MAFSCECSKADIGFKFYRQIAQFGALESALPESGFAAIFY